MSPIRSIVGREQSLETNVPILRAIRKEHDPFRLFLPSFLVFLRCTDFRCPHCHGVFRRDYLPHKVRLGSGERICKKCGKVFDDDAREWPELTRGEKIRYVLPTPIMGVVGGFLICVLIALFAALQPNAGVNWNFLEIVAADSVFLMICWGVLRFPGIRRSVQRYLVEHGESAAFGTKGK